MKLSFLQFLRNLAIFTIIIALVGCVVVYFLPDNYISPVIPYLFLFFFVVTLLVHFILLKATGKRFAKFVPYFMLATTLKLFLYAVVLLLYTFTHRADAINFIISFFILYLLFTAFETITLLRNGK